jgi:four helix bundle protein
MDLVEEVYHLSASFPRCEEYRVTSQLTRAAVSVAANIAEGRARGSRKEYAWFISVAKGSLMEVDTLLAVALRLNYIDELRAAKAAGLISVTGKMLSSLRARLVSRPRVD